MGRENYFSFSKTFLFLLHLLFLGSIFASAIVRDDFPPGFIFGAGSSAYQVEGAVAEDGRKPGIWDAFTSAGLVADKSNGEIAADQYHKYKEDVKLMHEMGLDAYRFSISWSRLMPDGRGLVNPKGLQYYNNLIDELVSYGIMSLRIWQNSLLSSYELRVVRQSQCAEFSAKTLAGIEPHITLYHFDFPQALQDEYEGLLSPKIVEDFTAYANVCFKEFGDRVKHWVTFNEPNIEPILAYDVGVFPPGRCSYHYLYNCSKGDSTSEPYRAAHNFLLAHASAATLYKGKYQAEQRGQIGITLLGFWFKSFTDSADDVAATQRILDFHIGWFLDPLIHGKYPAVMREIVGSRLPYFDAEESKKLKESFDFIGLNHYSLFYVQANPNDWDENDRDYIKDVSIKIPSLPGGALENVFTMRIPPLPSTPWALQALLEYVKVKYRNPPIIIHENGYGEFGISPTSGKGTDDDYRINFLQGYTESMLQAIRNGSNTVGYFMWSFLDCFETMFGYTARYGLYGVDFSCPERNRFPRLSAKWYSKFLRNARGRNQESKLVRTE